MKYLIYSIVTSFIFISSSCSKKVSTQPTETIKYLALGDSYTIGEGVQEEDRWPIQLSNNLKAADINLSDVKIIAKTGWTTSDLQNGMENQNLQPYNLVSLLIGVNNQYQGLPFDKFTTEFDQLLTTSITIANDRERVFVVSIPDYGVTPFGQSNSEKIANELDQYNDYMKEKCASEDILFINITEISRTLGDSPEALASDKLHPSGFQYQQWVSEIYPKVIELIQ